MTPRIALTTAAACLALLAGNPAFAQVPPPAGPPGSQPPLAATAPMPPDPPVVPIAPEAGAVASGRMAQWLLNPNGEADGLLLADGTQVTFPPHLSAAVMQVLKPGDAVHVSGWRAPDVPVVRMQSLSANGRSVSDQPPAPGMAPPRPRGPGAAGAAGALDAMSAQGRIERLLYTDRGDVRGVVLADKTIVRFPPHIGAAYAAQLQPGAPLHARGWGTRGAQGTALEATSLGATAATVREVFGGPGLEPAPQGPRGKAGPGGAREPRGPTPPAPLMAPAAPVPQS